MGKMDKREVKKLVREQILGGKTKEETFNNLFERSGLPDRKSVV